MDTYLRGLQGYPGLDLWWNHLLYGQPPPGLDLRLSLDLILQRTADKLLADLSGALLLLNAESGEILVMASHPTYNANHLDRNWDELVQDSHAPLLNRATLGRYPIDDLENILFPDGTSTQEWYTSPQIRIPTGDPPASDAFPQVFSPLQIALAAAALSADGIRPAPLLVTAVNTPRDGWMILPALGNPGEALSSAYARTTADSLAVEGSFIWQYLAVAPNGPDRAVTWYLGGTLSSWNGQPLALALLLEVNEPSLAEEIGRTVIEAAMQR